MLRQIRRYADRYRHAHGPYGHLFLPYEGSDVVALDCETTGLDSRHAELVSIAAVPVRNGRVCASESMDVHFQAPESLTSESITIHRLRPVDLDEGEEIAETLETLLSFIANRPIVGWCIDFDVAMINRYLRPLLGFDLPNSTIELSTLYQKKMRYWQPDIEPDLRFEAMARHLRVPMMARHSARGDAVTAGLMYLQLQRPTLDQ